MHPDDYKRIWVAADDYFSGRTPIYSTEFRLRHEDGSYRWFLSRAVAIMDAEGKVARMTGALSDDHDRRVAEEALREADQRKDEFLATLAHELRNPLAPIRTALDVVKLAPPGSAVLDTARSTMERQLTHMVRLVDDLLDVSRISRGRVDLRRERVDVRAVLDVALEAARPMISAQRHELVVTVPDRPAWLDADPTRIAQVVSNLLTNAAKYMPAGGVIELSAAREEGDVVVAVRDRGIGIAPEMLEQVFEMFVQLDRSPTRVQGGLGIGLALVRRLVEMHGGSVRAASAGAGQGSTFTVRLPAASAAPAHATNGAPPKSARAVPSRRVLVVDDNADAAETLAVLLQLEGHDTRSVSDGPAALVEARSFDPDVVFCDLGMPGMDGYEVGTRLRAERGERRLLLVALTGWGSEADRRRSQSAGFDVHLTKPVDASALRDVFARLSASHVLADTTSNAE